MTPLPGTQSAWARDSADLLRPALTHDTHADVCVVGAGMAGMLCAYSLARTGRRVLVLDDGPIGGGETGRTTAHLTNALDDRYFEIERRHGGEAARVCARSHTAAIDVLERITLEEAIPCDYTRLDGYLFLPPGGSQDVLARELGAAHRAGLPDVEWVASAPGVATGRCLRFPRQGQFHPLRFLAGVALAIERLRGEIHGATRVVRIDAGTPLTVRTASGLAVHADHVVVATNSPSNDLFTIHTKQAAYRTYALSAVVPAGSVAPALYWDTAQHGDEIDGPYHYVRLQPGLAPAGDDLLIVGGEDHPTGQHEDASTRWRRLEVWARVHWPIMGGVVHRWSGQVMEPLDGIAFIGANPTGPRGVFIVTGDSGMGMTHSAIAAIMMPDLVEGRRHPWAHVYDPARKPLHALGEFARHAGRMAARYADWLTPGADLNDIAPGEGRVVRRGLSLVAVYRDGRGALHARSAVCTHLGCIVQWNDAEKSWDCPCHGSRFDAMGVLLNGPARKDLARVALEPRATPGRDAHGAAPAPESAPVAEKTPDRTTPPP